MWTPPPAAAPPTLPKSPGSPPGGPRPPTTVSYGSGERREQAAAADTLSAPSLGGRRPRLPPTPHAHPQVGAPQASRAAAASAIPRGCGSGRAGRVRVPLPASLPPRPNLLSGAASFQVRRGSPPRVPGQERCRESTCALVPGLFRLSTAVPSAMTIVPESGRLESIPGCGGRLPARAEGGGRRARGEGRDGVERRSGSGRQGGAVADGSAVARAEQGGRPGRSPRKDRLAEGETQKREQPTTHAARRGGRERHGRGGGEWLRDSRPAPWAPTRVSKAGVTCRSSPWAYNSRAEKTGFAQW